MDEPTSQQAGTRYTGAVPVAYRVVLAACAFRQARALRHDQQVACLPGVSRRERAGSVPTSPVVAARLAGFSKRRVEVSCLACAPCIAHGNESGRRMVHPDRVPTAAGPGISLAVPFKDSVAGYACCRLRLLSVAGAACCKNNQRHRCHWALVTDGLIDFCTFALPAMVGSKCSNGPKRQPLCQSHLHASSLWPVLLWAYPLVPDFVHLCPRWRSSGITGQVIVLLPDEVAHVQEEGQ
jgi:hypothetical protein